MCLLYSTINFYLVVIFWPNATEAFAAAKVVYGHLEALVPARRGGDECTQRKVLTCVQCKVRFLYKVTGVQGKVLTGEQ